jgi:hypothetical protein
MARMVPNRLDTETQSHTERLLFEGFRDELENSDTVFHSVHRQSLDGEGRSCDGEADFVIAHPSRGVLVTEAKGGDIRNDPRTGEWTSIDRGGRPHRIGSGPRDAPQRGLAKRGTATPQARPGHVDTPEARRPAIPGKQSRQRPSRPA